MADIGLDHSINSSALVSMDVRMVAPGTHVPGGGAVPSIKGLYLQHMRSVGGACIIVRTEIGVADEKRDDGIL
jgi:hypothetical protein